MNALKHSFIAERHPSANKNIKEKCELSSSGDAFPTLDTIIIDHIKMAIAKANGKIAGPDGAASLLGLNTSTLWSKIRKYNIDPNPAHEKSQSIWIGFSRVQGLPTKPPTRPLACRRQPMSRRLHVPNRRAKGIPHCSGPPLPDRRDRRP